MSVSTQTASDDQVVKFWDELSLVGLPDDIDVQALFEPTGKIHFSPCFLSISVGTVAMLTMNEVFQLFSWFFCALAFVRYLILLSWLLPVLRGVSVQFMYQTDSPSNGTWLVRLIVRLDDLEGLFSCSSSNVFSILIVFWGGKKEVRHSLI